jgi:hypothetical protein
MRVYKPANRGLIQLWLCVVLVLSLALGVTLATSSRDALGTINVRISRLIYPTFGYPQLAKSGDSFTLEFDFRQDVPGNPLPSEVSDWQVTIRSVNDYTPYQADLQVLSYDLGNSLRWPQGSGRSVYQVYRVNVRVPAEVPADLYDLTVQVTADGAPVSDSQPHSLCVLSEWKQDYRVIQWTDVHVHDVQYGVSGFESTAWTDRFLHDALYLKKAIGVINTLHPDFLLISGDTVFGQRYLPEDWPPNDGNTRYGNTEYEYEYDWCYQELQALKVPVFMQIGNHDGYYDTIDDGHDWWTRTYGPLYYSFDYGNHHYTAVNSFDWDRSTRELKEFLTEITGVLNPDTWQGQVRGGGDAPNDSTAPDPSQYTGQLAWIRDDLAAHQTSGFRTIIMHHDPSVEGMWKKVDLPWPLPDLGSDGWGRRAMLRLCADYRVNLLLSGHDHKDQYHEQAWTGGGGTTIFPNATSLSIQKDGANDFFPGFKMAEFDGNTLLSHSYKLIGGVYYSYPYYDNCNVGGSTDLSTLDQTSITTTFSNGGNWSDNSQNVYCDMDNRLEKVFHDCQLDFFMPRPDEDNYYKATGGTVVGAAQVPGSPNRLNYQLEFDLPATAQKRVSLDVDWDYGAPTGTVSINGGAQSTTELDVVLQLQAQDDKSGVRDMMISNTADFEGAEWEPYATEKSWRLAEGPEGYRTVYVKYRDFCVPGHESETAYTSIIYSSSPGPTAYRWYFAEGYTGPGFEEWLCILNPTTVSAQVTITYMPEGADNLEKNMEIPAMSRQTVCVNTDAGENLNVSVKVEANREVVAERAMYFNYRGAWTGGHCVMGSKGTERVLYFAEGHTGPGFEEWLTIQNPGDQQAEVNLTYMMKNGNNHQVSHKVDPRSRYTVFVNQDCPEQGDLSVKLESSQPVIAERPMYFNYRGAWTGGHCVMGSKGTERVLYFAEGHTGPGFEEWLTIQNPGDQQAEVNLTYMMKNGNNHQVSHKVDPRSRYTVFVNQDCPEQGDLSVKLESSQPVIAERPMYFNYRGAWTGGHCVMGSKAVDLKWYLAEGYTGPGFEEWITVLNPNPGTAAVRITVMYMLKDGGAPLVRYHDVPPASRYTINANQDAGNGLEFSTIIISPLPVLAERPMYFDQHGWTGGHCVVAFSKQ